MRKTWEGQFEQYKTEFDFLNEANNVNECVRLYDVVGIIGGADSCPIGLSGVGTQMKYLKKHPS